MLNLFNGKSWQMTDRGKCSFVMRCFSCNAIALALDIDRGSCPLRVCKALCFCSESLEEEAPSLTLN